MTGEQLRPHIMNTPDGLRVVWPETVYLEGKMFGPYSCKTCDGTGDTNKNAQHGVWFECGDCDASGEILYRRVGLIKIIPRIEANNWTFTESKYHAGILDAEQLKVSEFEKVAHE